MSDCLDDYQLTQDDNNNYSTWGDAEEEEEEEEKEEKALEMMTNDDDGIQEIYLISDTDDPTALTEDDELEKSEDESSDVSWRRRVYFIIHISINIIFVPSSFSPALSADTEGSRDAQVWRFGATGRRYGAALRESRHVGELLLDAARPL